MFVAARRCCLSVNLTASLSLSLSLSPLSLSHTHTHTLSHYLSISLSSLFLSPSFPFFLYLFLTLSLSFYLSPISDHRYIAVSFCNLHTRKQSTSFLTADSIGYGSILLETTFWLFECIRATQLTIQVLLQVSSFICIFQLFIWNPDIDVWYSL